MQTVGTYRAVVYLSDGVFELYKLVYGLHDVVDACIIEHQSVYEGRAHIVCPGSFYVLGIGSKYLCTAAVDSLSDKLESLVLLLCVGSRKASLCTLCAAS